MKIVLMLFAMVFYSLPGLADTLYVPRDYTTIQEAIDAASAGDTVLVAPGTYLENIDFQGKAVLLKGEYGPGMTVIDGTQTDAVVQCVNNEGPGSVLDGFTIYNGTRGMVNSFSDPTVMNCVFLKNRTNIYSGGGMSNYCSEPSVTYCTFLENHALYIGGGMSNALSDPLVMNCTFMNNSVNGWGGGMCNSSADPTVINCTFEGNTASRGAGMYNEYNDPLVTNCMFMNNTASWYGGGMSNKYSSRPTVANCFFIGNTANLYGGGMGNYELSDAIVTN